MSPRVQKAALIAGFALLAILAVAGWTRNSGALPQAANSYNSPHPVYGPGPSPNQSLTPAPVTSSPYGWNQPVNNPPFENGMAPAGVHTAAYAPDSQNCIEPVYQSGRDASYESRYRTYSRPRVIRYVDTPQRDVVVERSRVVEVRRRGRSTKKSVAIVAGSAGVGAAIGALAGGGKGAGIGALGGGAAGFIYDRLTHNR